MVITRSVLSMQPTFSRFRAYSTMVASHVIRGGLYRKALPEGVFVAGGIELKIVTFDIFGIASAVRTAKERCLEVRIGGQIIRVHDVKRAVEHRPAFDRRARFRAAAGTFSSPCNR